MKRCEYCGEEFEPTFRHPYQKYCKNCGKKNSEKSKWYKREYIKANLEKLRIINQKYREENPEKIEKWNRKRKRIYYQNKQRALDYKGGCVICSSKENVVYHHLDPDEKKCRCSKLYHSEWDILKVELDKCIPLCEELHGKLEAELQHFKDKLKRGGYNYK